MIKFYFYIVPMYNNVNASQNGQLDCGVDDANVRDMHDQL